ncbi:MULTISPECIES: tellurite resistance TerB family protein [unclassified Devosia]|uniref:tellurite resistance TerB family protein n=1 Tax=unclassified Devosia TaxID=196773 RepID=UPI00145D2785|nr:MULTISPECIES: tellurite resistance TerB family protein [unclassified Devosia]MBJ6986713.1 tellurite resistance TerB family protein [Devosia sp. MC521]MBJ7576920.1 tellurite resistance TerB family protein [Devosia sp. MC532]MBK1793850.1 tellurite resistance TerB family protein [Devosia sp. WQ 349K1]QMW61745.1 tellurite resistance TerB family protein [Devosia sp. MC521]
MFNIDQILKTLQSDPNLKSKALTGAAGMAAGMLLSGGKPHKLLETGLKAGAIAAVGGLAYKAWQNHQANQAGQAAPVREDAFIPQPNTPAQEDLGKTLVRAMIAASKADGRIDADEKEAIFAKLNTMQLSGEEKAWVFDELSSPLDINAVVARADTPEHAAEIYAASLVAITADTAAEQAYLEALAVKLKLDPALVAEIHRQAGEKLPQPSQQPIAPLAYTPQWQR